MNNNIRNDAMKLILFIVVINGIFFSALISWLVFYQPTTVLNYFDIMAIGYNYEKQGRYTDAIESYNLALPKVNSLPVDERHQATIAVHNRLGATYKKKGDIPKAIGEFKISLRIGDKRYAPYQIQNLTRNK